MRTYLIGDIHGRADVYMRALELCEVRASQIPKGVTVCQVGDLIHGGPNSLQCLQISQRLLEKNPQSYIQLLGNHELHYLGGPLLHGDGKPLSRSAQQVLASISDNAKLACALQSRCLGEVLVTHGGLTRGLFEEIGSPGDAADAAALINSMPRNRSVKPGKLVTGQLDTSCGVAHARTGAELAGSWLSHQMPFSQIHGHEGVWWWPGEDFHSDVPHKVRERSGVDLGRRQSWVRIGGKMLLSIDPKPEPRWSASGWAPLQIS